MRLDARQVRFTQSFLPTWRSRPLRLGGRRGSLHLQEPALVFEGELLRFRLFGVEWLFRRALSEWTTVTVPYSRIVSVRRTRAWLLRLVLALSIAAAWAAAIWVFAEVPAEILLSEVVVVVVIVVTVLGGYALLRVRPTVTVVYRPKTGRRVRVTFLVRRGATRRAFVDALAAHRAAAARHAVTV
jgi:hypothetical protein